MDSHKPFWRIRMNNNETHRLLRIKDVMRATGISKSYIYALAKEGKFPKSIRLVKGGSAVCWLASDVEKWISDCIANQEEA
jgi:prophage regulatory protein